MRVRSEGGGVRRRLSAGESARRWDEYTLRHASGPEWVAWLADAWSFHAPALSRITAVAPPGGRVLEVGAGGAPCSLWLAARGYSCVAVDYRPRLVAAARRNAERLGLQLRAEAGDAFDLSRYDGFDVAFSLGMIEHWERADSVRALREQARAARYVVAVIPTRNTRFTGEITDERFYTPRELRLMLREAGLTGVRSFAYGLAPTRAARVASLALPHAALRLVQDLTSRTAMGHAAIGRSTPAGATARAGGARRRPSRGWPARRRPAGRRPPSPRAPRRP